MMSFSYRAKLSKKLNKCTYRPIWSEFCADPKYKIFTEALAKINFENHKELAMNEVHVTTAKVVLISLISGAAVALITHLFF